MEEHLNTYQVYLLRQLNKIPTIHINASQFRNCFLAEDLSLSEENLNDWEKQLIKEEYVTARKLDVPVFLSFPTPHIIHELDEIKITQKGRTYLKSLIVQRKAITVFEKANVPENSTSTIVFEHIKCLNGIWNNIKIMSEEDFISLFENTYYLIENKNTPVSIKQIPPTNISEAFIRKTYHGLYKAFKKKVSRDMWVQFIHKAFKQFTCSPDTTKGKFSQYSDACSYDADKKSIK